MHPDAYQQKNRQRRKQLAEEIHAQQEQDNQGRKESAAGKSVGAQSFKERADGHELSLETKKKRFVRKLLAPAVGFEPTTNRLTADRSTTELRWIKVLIE